MVNVIFVELRGCVVVIFLNLDLLVMKIEHVEFYDYFDTYVQHHDQNALYDMEFPSLYHVAVTIRSMLGTKDKPVFRQALVFMDNSRYLLVTPKCFDVHYHTSFKMMEQLKDSPFLKKYL